MNPTIEIIRWFSQIDEDELSGWGQAVQKHTKSKTAFKEQKLISFWAKHVGKTKKKLSSRSWRSVRSSNPVKRFAPRSGASLFTLERDTFEAFEAYDRLSRRSKQLDAWYFRVLLLQIPAPAEVVRRPRCVEAARLSQKAEAKPLRWTLSEWWSLAWSF